MADTRMDRLRQKANSLPLSPGVYLMKDAEGEVIYVGKSKKLKNRVTNYFTGTPATPKTARLVSHIADFDYIVCDSEIEALALENVQIKKYSPRYNIKLKDAKSYPYIKVTAEEYPRLTVTRERKSDRGRYFGPYRGTSDAYGALEAVRRIFSLPSCKLSFPKDIGRKRPCLYRDMERCVAPCTGGIGAEEYRALVRCAEQVLAGNITETVAHLRAQMEQAAEELAFERAAALRDSIHALTRLGEEQKVVADEKVNRDVFAFCNSGTAGVLSMLSVRGGALVNKNEFVLSACELTSPDDALPLIADYYDTAGNIPREIMLDFPLSEEDTALLSEYLSLNTRYKVRVRIPARGESRALCDMALENAREAARQAQLACERENKSVSRLATLLGLAAVPRRIEAYDISNLGNENITASMIVCEGGRLKRADYRTFSVRTTDGADDYGALREVLQRRLSHIGDGTASLGQKPDLILLDGGENHVRTAREVADALGADIPLIGMVKDDYHKTRALTDGAREISIAQEMPVYSFIYTLQEEVHRVAVRATMGQKRRSLTHSSLEKIPGIGPKKAAILLHAMPLKSIREASADALSAVRGISVADAERIFRYFHPDSSEPR